jgi:hypothetical protein
LSPGAGARVSGRFRCKDAPYRIETAIRGKNAELELAMRRVNGGVASRAVFARKQNVRANPYGHEKLRLRTIPEHFVLFPFLLRFECFSIDQGKEID